jgi:hypothetical protein
VFEGLTGGFSTVNTAITLDGRPQTGHSDHQHVFLGNYIASQREPSSHAVEECAVLRYCWTLRWLHPAHIIPYLTAWSTPEQRLTSSEMVYVPCA